MFETILVQQSAPAQQCESYFSTTETEALNISFPKLGQTRSRKVVTRSRSRITGKYPSWKMKRMVQWESGNERVVYIVLDADSAVIAFYEQPFCARYLHDGIERKHYPDVLIEFADGVEVWEIKDAQSPIDPDLSERTRILTLLFKQLGIRYRVVFVNRGRTKNLKAYCASIVRYGRKPISLLERESGRRFFDSNRNISWYDVESECLGAKSKNIVARLVLEGSLTVEGRSKGLLPTTKISVVPETRSLASKWRC